MTEFIINNYHKSLSQLFTDFNLNFINSASSLCEFKHFHSAFEMLYIKDLFKYFNNFHIIKAHFKHQIALLNT